MLKTVLILLLAVGLSHQIPARRDVSEQVENGPVTGIIEVQEQTKQPEEPLEPEVPREPEEQQKPAEPEEPQEPGEQEEPQVSGEPEEPQEAAEPEEPQTPVEPEEPEVPNDSDEPQAPAEPDEAEEPEESEEPHEPEIELPEMNPVGVCPENDFEFSTYLSDAKNCSIFYQCAHGVPYRMTCRYPLEFNPTYKVCDYPFASGCLLKKK